MSAMTRLTEQRFLGGGQLGAITIPGAVEHSNAFGRDANIALSRTMRLAAGCRGTFPLLALLIQFE
jgi:hypothetical protein